MNSRATSPVILVANNPLGHHLLTSQLLNTYQELNLDARIILLCNGTMHKADVSQHPWLEVENFASPVSRAFSYVNLLLKLIQFRRQYPQAVYHLRGFVAGALFSFSRLFALRTARARYIYDPRGAFFLEWREARRSRVIGRLLGIVERRLVQNSTTTIVTSDRFSRLYRRLFGGQSEYVTIYNSTSFPYTRCEQTFPRDDNLRFVYLGTFNYWHDMDEVVRVMASAAHQLGPDRVEIFIYTLPRFHEVAKERFGAIRCASINVEYVRYSDIPHELADKHVGVSVVRPTPSACIASPIKIADYVALGLVPLMNTGIGDFDAQFRANESGILYEFGGEVDLTDLYRVGTAPNKQIYDVVSHVEARRKLGLVVERLRNG